MKKDKKVDKIVKAGFVTIFIIGIISAILITASLSDIPEAPIIKEIRERTTQLVPMADGDPGAGVSGFFYAMIYPHQADPGTAYASNLSNASAYEYTDTVNSSMTGETPFSTTFDVVIKWGWNATHDWNSTGSVWEDSWVWLVTTCSVLSISADTNMTEIEIANASGSYRYMHYYLNNGGSGYTISQNQKFNFTDCKPFAVY